MRTRIGRLPSEIAARSVAAVCSRTTGNSLEASASGHPLRPHDTAVAQRAITRHRVYVYREMTNRVPCFGAPMSSIKQFQVTFDCAEPERVACF